MFGILFVELLGGNFMFETVKALLMEKHVRSYDDID